MNNGNAGVDEEVGGAADTGVEADESVSSADSEDGTDWKALYEKQVTETENYKTALTQKRGLRKAPATVVEEEEVDENKPATIGDIRKVLQQEVAPIVSQNKVDSVLETAVKDPEKRKLVKLYYETRIRQTGTSDEAVRTDIEAALAIADAHKYRKAASEVARAARRDTTPPMNGSGADRGGDAKGHKFSADQEKVLTATAQRLGQDPKKFIETAWKNSQGR